MLGINSEGNGATRASIDGSVTNPYKGIGKRGQSTKDGDTVNNTGTLYIIILSIIVVILFGVIIKQKL